ncbi:hypothetical protein GCM10009827_047760 [Dactylosporangium maewongense]|uniref:Uncharacterized protein n=1 Tax=Dactylosporangium maewongense TaxID=634393 RepID=A0ABN2AT86_9ACTN
MAGWENEVGMKVGEILGVAVNGAEFCGEVERPWRPAAGVKRRWGACRGVR